MSATSTGTSVVNHMKNQLDWDDGTMPDETPATTEAQTAVPLAETSPRSPAAVLPPATESSPQSPASTPSRNHPEWLIEQARDLGISNQEMENYTSNNLGILITRTRALLRAQQEDSRRQQALEQRPQPAAPVEPPPPKLTPEEEMAKDLETDVSEWDPASLKLFTKLYQKMTAKVAAVEGSVNQVGQVVRTTQANTAAQHIDLGFAALGPAAEAIIGKGGINDLPPNSKEVGRRKLIVQAAGINPHNPPTGQALVAKLKEGYDAVYGGVTPGGQAVQPNAYASGPGQPAAPQQPVASERPRGPDGRFLPTAQEWDEGAVAKPTQRQARAEGDPTANAVAAVRKKMDEQGLLDDKDFEL